MRMRKFAIRFNRGVRQCGFGSFSCGEEPATANFYSTASAKPLHGHHISSVDDDVASHILYLFSYLPVALFTVMRKAEPELIKFPSSISCSVILAIRISLSFTLSRSYVM